MPALRTILLLGCIGLIVGCSGLRRGDMDKVSAVSESRRVGNVYLVRGFIGVFSTGMDELGDKIRADGVSAEVFQGDQRRNLTEAIARQYAGRSNPEPLVLIGHSYGADDVLRIARDLREQNVIVDLLITCDPVTPPPVPENIHLLRNYYKPQGPLDHLPWLRGVPLEPDKQGRVTVRNLDITDQGNGLSKSGVNHFNIEKNPLIHGDVIAQLRKVCPPRSIWTSRNRPARGSSLPPLAVSHTDPDTDKALTPPPPALRASAAPPMISPTPADSANPNR